MGRVTSPVVRRRLEQTKLDIWQLSETTCEFCKGYWHDDLSCNLLKSVLEIRGISGTRVFVWVGKKGHRSLRALDC